MKHTAITKKWRCPLRRLAAFVCIFALISAITVELAPEAEAANNGGYVWKFQRVYSQDDLPTDGDWHPVLVSYEVYGTRRIMNTAERNSSTSDEVRFETISAAYRTSVYNAALGLIPEISSNYASWILPDTYDGDFPCGVWMKYAGRDGSNWDMKKYYMRDAKDGSAIFYGENSFRKYSITKTMLSSKELKELQEDTVDDYYGAMMDGQLYTPYTVVTDKKNTEYGSVKIFSNVPGTDSSFCIDSGGETVSLNDSKGHSWDLDQYIMFVGTRTWSDRGKTTGNLTVRSGQVSQLSDTAIGIGETVTVEEGAILSITGRVYFNGTLENYGTVVVEGGGSLEATHWPTGRNDKTVYGIYKGHEKSSLVVCKDGCVITGIDPTTSGYNYGRNGTGLELDGGSIVNKGFIAAPFGIQMQGAVDIENFDGAVIYVGYMPSAGWIGQMYRYDTATLASERVRARTWDYYHPRCAFYPVVINCTWSGDQHPIVYNEGEIYTNCGFVTKNGSGLTELNEAQMQTIFQNPSNGFHKYEANWTWYLKSYSATNYWTSEPRPMW